DSGLLPRLRLSRAGRADSPQVGTLEEELRRRAFPRRRDAHSDHRHAWRLVRRQGFRRFLTPLIFFAMIEQPRSDGTVRAAKIGRTLKSTASSAGRAG